jgi:hypothetical protein
VNLQRLHGAVIDYITKNARRTYPLHLPEFLAAQQNSMFPLGNKSVSRLFEVPERFLFSIVNLKNKDYGLAQCTVKPRASRFLPRR